MARSYGSGTISETRPGVWRLRVRAGVDPLTGKARVVSETFHGGRKEAQRRLAALVDRHGGRTATSTATLGRIIDDWLAVAPLARSTVTRYEWALKHLPDRWRAMRVDRIDTRSLERLYADLGRVEEVLDLLGNVHRAHGATTVPIFNFRL